MEKSKVDPSRNRYPYCIVWTPLPLITALIPFIGHTGICDEEGVIYDFSGPYQITVDDFAFGNPTKYVQLTPSTPERELWSRGLSQANDKFSQMNHNLVLNNCHSHVADALNNVEYGGSSGWNMVKIWWMVTTKSTYVSYGSWLATYAGFFLLVMIYYLIKYVFYLFVRVLGC
jgi:hypothetical protein